MAKLSRCREGKLCIDVLGSRHPFLIFLTLLRLSVGVAILSYCIRRECCILWTGSQGDCSLPGYATIPRE